MCGVTHMIAVSLMNIPILVPNSSKLHRMPVTSPPFPVGRAKKEIGQLLNKKLTLEERTVLVRIDVNLRELADSDLLRQGILDLRLVVEAVPVGAKSPWHKLLVAESD